MSIKEQEGARMNENIIKQICDFSKRHIVEVEIEFDCLGCIAITMLRDDNRVFRRVDRLTINNHEHLNDAIMYHLHEMVAKIDEKYDEPVLIENGLEFGDMPTLQNAT